MSASAGAVLFSDGQMLYWWYRYVPEPDLYETVEEDHAPSFSKCACGKDEPVHLHWLDMNWTGRACRRCRCITDFGGFDDEVRATSLTNEWEGQPKWLDWAANLPHVSGGEPESTLVYWNSVREIVKATPSLSSGELAYTIDDKENESIYATVSREHLAAAHRLLTLPREGVTPELIAYSEQLADLAEQRGRVCAGILAAVRASVDLNERPDARTYEEQSFQHLIDTCDAYLERKTPPEPPWEPSLEQEVQDFEKNNSLQRKELLAQLQETRQRARLLLEFESRTMSVRLRRQHDRDFRYFEY